MDKSIRQQDKRQRAWLYLGIVAGMQIGAVVGLSMLGKGEGALALIALIAVLVSFTTDMLLHQALWLLRGYGLLTVDQEGLTVPMDVFMGALLVLAVYLPLIGLPLLGAVWVLRLLPRPKQPLAASLYFGFQRFVAAARSRR